MTHDTAGLGTAVPTLTCSPADSHAGSARGQGASAIHPWRVLHACQKIGDVLRVVELQCAAGMRPSIVTPAGVAPHPAEPAGASQGNRSLLRAWQEVRQWRNSILEANLIFDLLHAHCFTAGMAAVRNCSAVVYDMVDFVEELAVESGERERHSWLARSFRVAEQFVLLRAGALVVHTQQIYERALSRGAREEDVFLIENLLPAGQAAERYDAAYRHAFSRRRSPNIPLHVGRLQPLAACL